MFSDKNLNTVVTQQLSVEHESNFGFPAAELLHAGVRARWRAISQLANGTLSNHMRDHAPYVNDTLTCDWSCDRVKYWGSHELKVE